MMRPSLVDPIGPLTALYMVFREKREELLQLDARKRVHDHVAQYPGLHLSEIARTCGMETNHVKYHLEYLEARGILTSQREANYVRWYAKRDGALGAQEALSPREKQILSQLRRPIPLHVALILLDRETSTHGELLPIVGVAHGTLHYHLKNMERNGIVQANKEGRERRYTLSERDLLLGLLLRYRPPDALVAGFLDAWENLTL